MMPLTERARTDRLVVSARSSWTKRSPVATLRRPWRPMPDAQGADQGETGGLCRLQVAAVLVTDQVAAGEHVAWRPM